MSQANGQSNHEKVIIIGSGPAGYTAAIYAARAELKPLMFSGMQPGGQLMITTDVENYPGYPEGIMGPEMMEDFRKQAERFGTRIKYEPVVKVDLESTPKRLWSDSGEEYTADSVIISTGAKAKWLGIEAEEKYANKGVSACAVCDGFFFRGKEVVIVGGGDTAAEEALYLSKLATTVHMLVRRDALRASKIMAARVQAAENVKVYWNTEAFDISGDDKVEQVHVRNNKTGEEQAIDASAFFVAIGHKPSTEIFDGQITMDDAGYIIVDAGTSKTNLEGVFACGDAADKVYRQAVTAAGTGCMAALDAERWLAAQEAPVSA
ncbi:thioredoxin-disulfide reductase [Pontibacter sp. G13]|uniref:thioredoxin-disulfide reductase n=1 Tax=Pontibacter sp. G13 TaxID=3074898 RepID=UPI00288B646E|nr:thioredoxin-disulfide reductase [Pontibacter sp. G13]WNJ16642.1 thioredoxin-disulfide reductase [Pontibacter sp. G13]